MAQISSNLFSIQIVPTPVLMTSFDLTSAVGGANLPFALGFAFRKGDVPAGAQVAGNIPALQVSEKNRWPDGSLKFATVSGRADLVAGVARTIKLGVGVAPVGAALTTSDLRATGITASVGAGVFGAAAWSGADWDAPFQAWISGPQMSSWVYRKALGADPHLVAWLEVRLFTDGAVEILPWIENGYLNVAAPINKNAEYVFTLGGTERFRATFDLPNHCRSVLISGSRFSHWLGADPQVVPNHDKAYLQATRLVPTYGAVVPDSSGVWSTLPQTYSPLQQGNYANAMGMGGYQSAIGLLPEWDVLYLASNSRRAYAGVITNAYSAGRFGIHYRDETTQRPLRFSSYPNLVTHGGASTGIANTGASSKNSFTPGAQGTTPPTWDSPHHPSVGFTAYLLTGRFYFMEEVQFAATVNYLKNTDHARKFAGGVFQSNVGANTTRGAAWAIRTLAQAACVTPDNDNALRAEFTASMAANVEFYYATMLRNLTTRSGSSRRIRIMLPAPGIIPNQRGCRISSPRQLDTRSTSSRPCRKPPREGLPRFSHGRRRALSAGWAELHRPIICFGRPAFIRWRWRRRNRLISSTAAVRGTRTGAKSMLIPWAPPTPASLARLAAETFRKRQATGVTSSQRLPTQSSIRCPAPRSLMRACVARRIGPL